MKQTLYTDIVKYWNKINETSKLKMLQEYENQNAKENNREARKLVLEDFNNTMPGINAIFSQKKPDVITIIKTNKFATEPEHALSIAYHEGLHATIYDYFTFKNIILKSYKKLNTKELYNLYRIDKAYRPVSAKENLSSEENYVMHETLCNTTDNYLNSVENMEDFKTMTLPYIQKIKEYIIFKKTYDIHREMNPALSDNKVIPKELVQLSKLSNTAYEKYFSTNHVKLKQNAFQVTKHLEQTQDLMDTIILKEIAKLDTKNDSMKLLNQIKDGLPYLKF